MDTIESLIKEFTGKITRVAEQACVQRMLASVEGKTVTPGRTTNGRKKGPIQLCPVPKCRNRAAPVYGMVCAEHKGLPKRQIAKYREARRRKAIKK